MANGDNSPKNIKDYIKSTWEHPSKWGERLAEGLIRLERKYLELSKEHKETKSRLDEKEIEEIKNSIDGEIDKKIKGKKGIFSEFKISVYRTFFTTSGIATLMIGAGMTVGVYYLANKTTTGNIIKIENDIKSIKRSNQGSANVKKSIDDILAKQKIYDTQLKSNDGQISEIKNSIDSYKKSLDELKLNYDNALKEMETLKKGEGNLEKKLDEYRKEEDNKGVIYAPQK